ncbi:MAG: hypothetical protein H7Y30_11490 [Pyrinomonadaceae bacterium]|nr:hypothetical protein [Pyrinomonadaceae bacterium]
MLLVSTGNVRNSELEAIFTANLESIADKFDTFDFIEISQQAIIFHV